MIVHSRSTKPAAKSPALRTPYGVGLRVPTIASPGSFKISISPLTTKPIGIAASSFNCDGHCSVSGIMNWAPAFAMLAAISFGLVARTRSIVLPYLIGS